MLRNTRLVLEQPKQLQQDAIQQVQQMQKEFSNKLNHELENINKNLNIGNIDSQIKIPTVIKKELDLFLPQKEQNIQLIQQIQNLNGNFQNQIIQLKTTSTTTLENNKNMITNINDTIKFANDLINFGKNKITNLIIDKINNLVNIINKTGELRVVFNNYLYELNNLLSTSSSNIDTIRNIISSINNYKNKLSDLSNLNNHRNLIDDNINIVNGIKDYANTQDLQKKITDNINIGNNEINNVNTLISNINYSINKISGKINNLNSLINQLTQQAENTYNDGATAITNTANAAGNGINQGISYVKGLKI